MFNNNKSDANKVEPIVNECSTRKIAKKSSKTPRPKTPEQLYTPTQSPQLRKTTRQDRVRSLYSQVRMPMLKGNVAEDVVREYLTNVIKLTPIPCGKNRIDQVYLVEHKQQLEALLPLLLPDIKNTPSKQSRATRHRDNSVESRWYNLRSSFSIMENQPFIVAIEVKSDNAKLTPAQKHIDYVSTHLAKLAKKEIKGKMQLSSAADKEDHLPNYQQLTVMPILPLLIRANNFRHSYGENYVDLHFSLWKPSCDKGKQAKPKPITIKTPINCRHLANSREIGNIIEKASTGWLCKMYDWEYVTHTIKNGSDHGIDAIFVDKKNEVHVVEIKAHIGDHQLKSFASKLSKKQQDPIAFTYDACWRITASNNISHHVRKNIVLLLTLLTFSLENVHFQQATVFTPNYGQHGPLDVYLTDWGTPPKDIEKEEKEDKTAEEVLTKGSIGLFSTSSPSIEEGHLPPIPPCRNSSETQSVFQENVLFSGLKNPKVKRELQFPKPNRENIANENITTNTVVMV